MDTVDTVWSAEERNTRRQNNAQSRPASFLTFTEQGAQIMKVEMLWPLSTHVRDREEKFINVSLFRN
jgi:hypothetical protein